MSKQTNDQIERYVVLFPGYNSHEDEECQNYVSYSTKLDNIQGMTNAYSLAVAASDSHNGTIFAEINGELIEHKKKQFRN